MNGFILVKGVRWNLAQAVNYQPSDTMPRTLFLVFPGREPVQMDFLSKAARNAFIRKLDFEFLIKP